MAALPARAPCASVAPAARSPAPASAVPPLRRGPPAPGAPAPWRRSRVRAAAGPMSAAQLETKLSLASSIGKLDLSDCGLEELPAGVCAIDGLEELSLSGNRLRTLPESIGGLTQLKKLGLAGNCLEELPESIGRLTALDGLWLHGNCLRALPDSIGDLGSLSAVNLSGNFLTRLPASIGRLARLESLGLAGNELEALPESIGALSRLQAVSLHGNRLVSLPASFAGLTALQSASLQGNRLASLPEDLSGLASLLTLNVADNALAALPASLAHLPRLAVLVAYGNRLGSLPPGLLAAPALRQAWLEGNPLDAAAVAAAAADVGPLVKALGLDASQVAGLPADAAGRLSAGPLRTSAICPAPSGATHGYLKVAAGPGQAPRAERVLVVAMGSAPGDPNWAGLLRRTREEMEQRGTPGADFDVMYVVDPHRAWYGGGDADGAGLDHYRGAVARAAAEYRGTVTLGDSMGGSACLLMSDLADVSLAFTPQTQLTECSIRPGRPREWLARVGEACRERVAEAGRAGRQVRVLTGSWKHDLDQARFVEDLEGVDLEVFSFDSHRLAKWLDSQGRLAPIVASGIAAAATGERLPSAGTPAGVRLSNLL